MAVNQKRMGGRFMVIPFEVYDILKELKRPCRDLYTSILRNEYIYEDWELDDTWVIGSLKATKTELFTAAPISEGGFFETAWPGLAKAGLVAITSDGRILLPRYKKKADTGISPSEVAELRQRIEMLESALGSDEDPDTEPEESGQTRKETGASEEAKASYSEAKASYSEAFASYSEAPSRARESFKQDLDKEKDPPPSGPGDILLSFEQERCHSLLTEEQEEGMVDGGVLKLEDQESKESEDTVFYCGAANKNEAAVKLLVNRGVKTDAAESLVAEFGAEKVMDNVRTVERDARKGVKLKSIPGVLVWRIRNNYAAGLEPEEEPERESPHLLNSAAEKSYSQRRARVQSELDGMAEAKVEALKKRSIDELVNQGIQEGPLMSDFLIRAKMREIIGREMEV